MVKFSDTPKFTKTPDQAPSLPWKDVMDKIFNRWVPEYGLNIDPDFQRGHVWDEAKQIRYVEYILRGGKSSRDLYFNHPGWMRSFKGDFVLVDGKQRLEAVRKFLSNELPAFGHLLGEFEDSYGYDPSFTIHVNDLPKRADVLQWYLDLNSGGVVHTQEELDRVRQLLEMEGTK